MTSQLPENKSVTQVPGQEDLVAVPTSPGGVAYVPVDEDAQFVRPKGRTAAAISLATAQSVDNTEGGVSKIFYPQIMSAFDVGKAGLGDISALGMYARMICGPLWAMAADRWGRKKILFIVTGLWGFWTIATGLAQSWNQLMLLYGIALVGTVASEPIMNGLLGSLYAKSERGKAFGTVRGVSSFIGMALTPALGQLGDYDNGWRWAMVAMGVMSIISGILILIFVHEPKRVESKIADDPDAGVFTWSDAAKLFKIPTLVGMALMLPMITSLVMFAYQSTYWAKDLGYGVKNAAYLYTVMQLGMLCSAFIGGFLGDWFQRRFGDKGRIMFFQLYALAFAAMTFVAFQVSFPKGGYYVVVFFLGLIFSLGFSGCVLPMVSSVAPKQLSATAFAVLFSLIQGAVTGILLQVSGRVADNIGLQDTFLYFVTLPYVANAVFWTIFYKIYPKDVARQAERTELIARGRF
ncbi:MFS transporter [Luteococcus sp.]|uniref:MFS transporter n=1 Tax=Luteococcus sp. TaxID=1969402 RepID=UPI00373676A8